MKPYVLYITYMGLSEPLVESQVLTYLRELSLRNNNIHVFSFEKHRFLPKGRIRAIKESLAKYNIKWFFLRYHKSPVFFAKGFDLFMGFIFTFYIVVTKRINVIHARGAMPAFLSFFVSRILNCRFIFDVRGLMAKEYVDGNIWKRSGMYYRIVDFMEKTILRYSDGIVVLTEEIRHVIGSRDYTGIDIKGRISVIPTAVDARFFDIKNHLSGNVREKLGLGDRFIFLYIGSLGTWYMLEEMAGFIKINSSNFKESFFLIVTQSTEVSGAAKILRKAGFDNKDFSIVRSEHKDMPAYINASDVGMMFIKPCFSKRASCPTKFGEYLACGLPVVLNSGIGDCDRIIRDYNAGVMVNGFDTRNYLASGLRLKDIIENRGVISELCRKAAIKEFSLDYAVDAYDRIYKER